MSFTTLFFLFWLLAVTGVFGEEGKEFAIQAAKGFVIVWVAFVLLFIIFVILA